MCRYVRTLNHISQIYFNKIEVSGPVYERQLRKRFTVTQDDARRADRVAIRLVQSNVSWSCRTLCCDKGSGLPAPTHSDSLLILREKEKRGGGTGGEKGR